MATMTKPLLLVTLVILLLQSCASMGPKPAEAILGNWQTTIGVFPLVVTYGADTVKSGSNPAIPYQLSGNELTYADGGKQVRLVSFNPEGEMIQLDPVTGTEHKFAKLP
jgi:hypothetical protein